MRSLIIALALALTAAVAFAQMPNLKGPAIPKVEVKVPDGVMPVKDAILDASIVEENGEYYLVATVLLIKQYPHHGIHLSVSENTTADGAIGTWETLTRPPYDFMSPVSGKNNVKAKLLRAPSLDYIRLTLTERPPDSGQSGTPHVSKVYELYCVGKQIRQ